VKRLPDDWSRFHTQSLLGEALLGQHRLAEAESPLVEGFQGLQARAGDLPATARGNLAEARGRVERLYRTMGCPERADALLRPGDRDAAMPDGPDAFAR
jgi:hypothetical protein